MQATPAQQNPSKSIMLVAGEASGDLLGARLVNELKHRNLNLSFYGMGSTKMLNAGVDLILDNRSIAVMGIIEVLKRWGEIHRALDQLKEVMQQRKPDLLVLIDYQEFNLKLAKFAKASGITVLFYVSPQIWAWRPKRVNTIGQHIDMMAVLFPFEEAPYKKAGVPVRYVGHPLTAAVFASLSAAEAHTQFSLDPAHETVGLFPGSRSSEIHYNLPVILESAKLLSEKRPNIQFVLPLASGLNLESIQAQIEQSDCKITVLQEANTYDIIQVCDAIICASGTVTLEIALMQTPMVVIYKMATLSYLIMKPLLIIDHVSLVNIIAGKEVVKELLQSHATAKNISHEIEQLLDNQDYRAQVIQDLNMIKTKLGNETGAKRIADLSLEMLGIDIELI